LFSNYGVASSWSRCDEPDFRWDKRQRAQRENLSIQIPLSPKVEDFEHVLSTRAPGGNCTFGTLDAAISSATVWGCEGVFHVQNCIQARGNWSKGKGSIL
jgi:hypothetical protein